MSVRKALLCWMILLSQVRVSAETGQSSFRYASNVYYVTPSGQRISLAGMTYGEYENLRRQYEGSSSAVRPPSGQQENTSRVTNAQLVTAVPRSVDTIVSTVGTTRATSQEVTLRIIVAPDASVFIDGLRIQAVHPTEDVWVRSHTVPSPESRGVESYTLYIDADVYRPIRGAEEPVGLQRQRQQLIVRRGRNHYELRFNNFTFASLVNWIPNRATFAPYSLREVDGHRRPESSVAYVLNNANVQWFYGNYYRPLYSEYTAHPSLQEFALDRILQRREPRWNVIPLPQNCNRYVARWHPSDRYAISLTYVRDDNTTIALGTFRGPQSIVCHGQRAIVIAAHHSLAPGRAFPSGNAGTIRANMNNEVTGSLYLFDAGTLTFAHRESNNRFQTAAFVEAGREQRIRAWPNTTNVFDFALDGRRRPSMAQVPASCHEAVELQEISHGEGTYELSLKTEMGVLRTATVTGLSQIFCHDRTVALLAKQIQMVSGETAIKLEAHSSNIARDALARGNARRFFLINSERKLVSAYAASSDFLRITLEEIAATTRVFRAWYGRESHEDFFLDGLYPTVAFTLRENCRHYSIERRDRGGSVRLYHRGDDGSRILVATLSNRIAYECSGDGIALSGGQLTLENPLWIRLNPSSSNVSADELARNESGLYVFQGRWLVSAISGAYSHILAQHSQLGGASYYRAWSTQSMVDVTPEGAFVPRRIALAQHCNPQYQLEVVDHVGHLRLRLTQGTTEHPLVTFRSLDGVTCDGTAIALVVSHPYLELPADKIRLHPLSSNVNGRGLAHLGERALLVFSADLLVAANTGPYLGILHRQLQGQEAGIFRAFHAGRGQEDFAMNGAVAPLALSLPPRCPNYKLTILNRDRSVVLTRRDANRVVTIGTLSGVDWVDCTTDAMAIVAAGFSADAPDRIRFAPGTRHNVDFATKRPGRLFLFRDGYLVEAQEIPGVAFNRVDYRAERSAQSNAGQFIAWSRPTTPQAQWSHVRFFIDGSPVRVPLALGPGCPGFLIRMDNPGVTSLYRIQNGVETLLGTVTHLHSHACSGNTLALVAEGFTKTEALAEGARAGISDPATFREIETSNRLLYLLSSDRLLAWRKLRRGQFTSVTWVAADRIFRAFATQGNQAKDFTFDLNADGSDFRVNHPMDLPPVPPEFIQWQERTAFHFSAVSVPSVNERQTLFPQETRPQTFPNVSTTAVRTSSPEEPHRLVIGSPLLTDLASPTILRATYPRPPPQSFPSGEGLPSFWYETDYALYKSVFDSLPPHSAIPTYEFVAMGGCVAQARPSLLATAAILHVYQNPGQNPGQNPEGVRATVRLYEAAMSSNISTTNRLTGFDSYLNLPEPMAMQRHQRLRANYLTETQQLTHQNPNGRLYLREPARHGWPALGYRIGSLRTSEGHNIWVAAAINPQDGEVSDPYGYYRIRPNQEIYMCVFPREITY